MAERTALLARYQALTDEAVHLVEVGDWPLLQTRLEERARLERIWLDALAVQPASEQERDLVLGCVARLEPLLLQLEKALDGLNTQQKELEQEQQDLNRVGRNLQRIDSAYR
jgi:hypothetical protein